MFDLGWKLEPGSVLVDSRHRFINRNTTSFTGTVIGFTLPSMLLRKLSFPWVQHFDHDFDSVQLAIWASFSSSGLGPKSRIRQKVTRLLTSAQLPQKFGSPEKPARIGNVTRTLTPFLDVRSFPRKSRPTLRKKIAQAALQPSLSFPSLFCHAVVRRRFGVEFPSPPHPERTPRESGFSDTRSTNLLALVACPISGSLILGSSQVAHGNCTRSQTRKL